MSTLWIAEGYPTLLLRGYMLMPVQVTLLFYSSLMFALALIVRWEAVRRRRGPTLKAGHLSQVGGPRIPYTPPPDRSRRSLDAVRR